MVALWSLRPEKPWRIVVRTPEEFRETVEEIRRRGELPDLTDIEAAGDPPAWLPVSVREDLPGWSGGIFSDSAEDAAAWYERRCRERKKRERN